MTEVLYRPQARLDLQEIYHFIARDNPVAAAKQVRLLEDKARRLAAAPRMGPSAEALGKDLRRFCVESYLIFYRPVGGGIVVERILHGARDIEALFADDANDH